MISLLCCAESMNINHREIQIFNKLHFSYIFLYSTPLCDPLSTAIQSAYRVIHKDPIESIFSSRNVEGFMVS